MSESLGTSEGGPNQLGPAHGPSKKSTSHGVSLARSDGEAQSDLDAAVRRMLTRTGHVRPSRDGATASADPLWVEDAGGLDAAVERMLGARGAAARPVGVTPGGVTPDGGGVLANRRR